MDLRRIRVELTLLFSLMAAIAVGALAWFAIQTGVNGIYDSAEREAEAKLTAAAEIGYNPWNEDYEEANTWNVEIDEKNQQTYPYLGGAESVFESNLISIEPPLLSIADDRANGQRFTEFEQDDKRFLALAEVVDEYDIEVEDEDGEIRQTPRTQTVVAFIPLDEFDTDAQSLRFRVVLAAVASILITSLAGYFLAARSLRPARLAMAQQRDFIADAAHELRTPLAVIKASAGHALSRPRASHEYEESLGEIITATDRAGASVSELLELARLDAGQAQPRTAPLRADLLVEEVAASIRIDDVIVRPVSAESIVVDADYNLLRQVVDTLTRNSAARSTDITLNVQREDKVARFTILDNGPGFDETVLPHVFDRFRRGDSLGSSGLGMAIAKKIVEAHNGEIEAGNRPNGGAQVSFTVPLDAGLDL